MPNAINKEVFERLVPPEKGEQKKGWLYRVSKELKLPHEEVTYLYHDKRAKSLARLQSISGHLQRVHLQIQHLTEIKGELDERNRQQWADLCSRIMDALKV